jgi:hypothetical protein
MDTVAFLRHVLPLEGPYCICNDGRKPDGTKTYIQHGAASINEAAAIATRLDQYQKNVFFAVGALIQGKVWDDKRQRHKVSRSGDNIRGVRAYIMDLDAGPDRQYPTVVDAATALKQFIKKHKLPIPTIVNSGNGLHVYWTLVEEVQEALWEENGARLKQLAIDSGLKIDVSRTADSSSVLRVVNTHNYKYTPPPMIEVVTLGTPTPNDQFHNALLAFDHSQSTLLTTAAPTTGFGSNISKPIYDGPVADLSLKTTASNCQTYAYTIDPENQEQGKARVPEPAWHAALLLSSFMRKPEQVIHLISKSDPRYDPANTDQKYAEIMDARKKGVGPPTCKAFQKAYAGHPTNADCCAGCPSLGKITSPAAVGKYVELAPPILQQINGHIYTIPNPPAPFIRTTKGIGMGFANPKTGANDVLDFCDYDMYPIRLRVDERTGLEDDVRWKVKLPKQDWIEVDIPHTPSNQLRTTLSKRGMYIDEPYIPQMNRLMSAYMRQLQNELPREMAFSKLGWRPDNSFVYGKYQYFPDGHMEEHSMSHALESAIENGIVTAGDYDTWRQDINIYKRGGLEAYRSTVYCDFGSILYPMTGQIATIVSATGVTGTGKSTLLDVCASVFGDPSKLVIRGDRNLSTRAAAEVRADAMNNLPVWMDETTGRDPKEIAELIFNYSGGKGKIRSTATGGIRGDIATWSNMMLTNANTDDYERIASVHRDGSQHMMRLIQWHFVDNMAITKAEGDNLRNSIRENHGHAGHIFIQYVVANRDAVQKRVRDAVSDADKAVGAKSEERFWTAGAACGRVAGEICNQLGILQGWPVTTDVQWMYNQIPLIRHQTTEQLPQPGEVMAEFLDAHLINTLTIGSKGAGNIDDIIHEPRGELIVRLDIDLKTIWVSRSSFRDYCVEQGVSFNRTIHEMEKNGMVLRNNVLKVLGADTTFAKGKVRCIELDLVKVSGGLAIVTSTQPTNVPTKVTK